MKIAFVHPNWPGNEGTGATHSASRIVSGLAERGHELTVYCATPPPEEADVNPDMTLKSLHCSGYPYHSDHQLNRALRERIEEFDAYDITHSYLLGSIPAMGDIAERTATTTVVTLNAYRGVCPKNDLRYLDREPCTSNGIVKCTACSITTSGGHDEYGHAYRSAGRLGNLKLVRESERTADRIDGYHALSPHVKETYAGFGYPDDRISVIPNILDERFCRNGNHDFEKPYELLYVGSLDEHKGVDNLVPILDRLRQQSGSAFRLTVVGDGGLRSELERQATARGLDAAVSVPGRLPNKSLPDVFASHDLFVYPGRWDEPFGRVFLESLAAGTPVIASDVGSVEDIIGDGGVVTDGSVGALSVAIEEVCDTDTLATLSSAARRTVKAYRPETVLPEFIELYDRLR